jgi:hypothetical protein
MAVIPASGTMLSVDKLGTGVTWVEVGQIESIEGPSNSVGSIEKTNLSSLRKEYRPGLPDGGEVSLDVQFDPTDAEHVYLRGLADTPVVKSWRVTYPCTPAVKDTFDGFVTAFNPSAAGDEDNLMASVTIKVTGEIVTT